LQVPALFPVCGELERLLLRPALAAAADVRPHVGVSIAVEQRRKLKLKTNIESSVRDYSLKR
jgi:hypothetical protein